MKRRDTEGRTPREQAVAELAQALASVTDPDVMADFLQDLCTPAELEALSDRWAVVPMVADGMPYRQVHEETGVSVTTVGRVARCVERGTGYRAVLAHTRGAPADTG